MATYTDNYQLTKPTYAEQADIGVINSNMNKIDEVMHSSQISLAPAYDSTQTYAEGDVVMYELLMYKCISPTTGVWDASKWERTTASESGGGGSAELDILGEGNGAVVSFADGASAELAKCIAEINPTQDLHGYDKPWSGGAGKNLLPLTVDGIKAANTDGSWSGNVYTFSGGTFTILTNNGGNVTGIKIDGTFSGQPVFFLGTEDFYAGNTYLLNGAVSNASNFRLAILTKGSDNGNGYTYTPSEDDLARGIIIYCNNNPTADNLIFRPMVRLFTVTDATFEPYSNICPISGSTSVTVTVSDGETSTTKTTPLGQTVYGGQLNVLTGELTIDRGFITITSESQLTTFTYNAENGSFSQVASDGKISNAKVMCISNIMEGIPFNNRAASAYVDVDRCYSDETGKIRIRNRNSVTINTKADLFARFEGAEICYFLATPQTVQLTPQEVNSLLGQNNISADTGDIDIVYVKASAPIQPNPTGTPTATLKKLGIEGTVFEVEGGGGGSSEAIITGQERVVGTYNNKPLYQLDVQADDITGNVNIVQAPTSIGRLVSYKGCAYDRTNDQYVALPLYATNSYYMRLYIYGGYIYMETPTSIHIDVSITLRYTKITD